ncbi:probable LRR receptor-like serine/threonine-protein kinase At3g47570 [Cornus florida]|uniref:probable LRR receptor-like serine/threonine-protein kinase At3g47570 n=1 Tax=Cornus florida TaxID=4283 RepID=UPI00289A810E|nr:probable LRR receptor-like serine/threonine-protein kinase At3g47570 [Cornus florida]
MGRFGIALLLIVLQQLCLSCMVCRALFSSNYTDESALLAFKSAVTLDPNNVLGSNWTQQTNFCQWVGVSCSRRHGQRVTSLKLIRIGLHGTISPHVGNLSFLKMLNLGDNNFRGQLIHEISHLRRLKVLILRFNYLEGVIPASIHHCRQLQYISLSRNEFTSSIPKELSTLSSLSELYLGRNKFHGTIPSFFGNMSGLKRLGLESNNFHGNIPNEIRNVPCLEVINFGGNDLTGSIPPFLFNISSIQRIHLDFNDLSGNLPLTSSTQLSNLKILSLGVNQLSGNIPSYLSNFSMLTALHLSSNQFTGTVPTSLGCLESLTLLDLHDNQLTIEPRSHELSFLTSLTSLKSLEILDISNNPFHGILPDSFGNLSTSLLRFRASNCQLMGRIPEGIGSFTNLNYLILSCNNFNGSIPSTIEGMKELQRLCLDSNRLEGAIPKEICSLRNLGDIRLHNNNLSGSIPACIGNVSGLRTLSLQSNSLNSSIPLSLWSLDNMWFLNLSFNSLTTLDPNIRALKSLEAIDLSWNQISGNIPSTLGAFESLSSINLTKNSFSGTIPESFGNLITLDFMDLSHNNLSGSIPKSLEALSHLKCLNLSYNKLSGEIPNGGPFANFTVESFIKNEALCGQPTLQVPPCSGSRTKHFPYKYVLPAIVASVAIFIALLYKMLRKYYGNRTQAQSSTHNLLDGMEHRLFSYQELCNATNNFCETNLIGVGGFGAVYKGILSDGTNVAVKILNLQLEEASKSFEAECKVLRTVRHRNFVKVISTCSNTELRALVLQYMPNGSLEKWLYSHNYCLNLLQRVSIMLDVAFALDYLHQGQLEPIVHCDLKPSNVLLDEDMVAHVGDFGIAKILAENKTATQTETLGTVGYIAPEYGSEGRVSIKSDIYSYGIMLLETFTGKNPRNEIFGEELNLRQWVSASLPHKLSEIIDRGVKLVSELCFQMAGPRRCSLQGDLSVEDYIDEIEHLMIRFDISETEEQLLLVSLGVYGLKLVTSSNCNLIGFLMMFVSLHTRWNTNIRGKEMVIDHLQDKEALLAAELLIVQGQGFGHIASECPNRKIVALVEEVVEEESEKELFHNEDSENEDEITYVDQGECLVNLRNMTATHIEEVPKEDSSSSIEEFKEGEIIFDEIFCENVVHTKTMKERGGA